MIKHSIRYFLNKPIRALWDGELSKWWYSATDVVFVLTDSKNPRIYWNAIKRRNPELNTFCRQLKLYADDGKKYLADVVDETGIKKLGRILRSKNNIEFEKWLDGSLDPIDEQSKKKAYDFYKTELIEEEEIGKTIALQKIHAYLFEGRTCPLCPGFFFQPGTHRKLPAPDGPAKLLPGIHTNNRGKSDSLQAGT